MAAIILTFVEMIKDCALCMWLVISILMLRCCPAKLELGSTFWLKPSLFSPPLHCLTSVKWMKDVVHGADHIRTKVYLFHRAVLEGLLQATSPPSTSPRAPLNVSLWHRRDEMYKCDQFVLAESVSRVLWAQEYSWQMQLISCTTVCALSTDAYCSPVFKLGKILDSHESGCEN